MRLAYERKLTSSECVERCLVIVCLSTLLWAACQLWAMCLDARKPLHIDIIKPAAPDAPTHNLVASPWQLCSISVPYEVDGARVYEVRFRCGVSGAHK